MAKINKKWIVSEIINSKFIDAYDPKEESYDIVFPILNTNQLLENNLKSIFSNIPVNRLLVGDAGSTDDSIKILHKFPRVEIFDHKNFKTSGVCIIDLIRRVNTKHFFSN